MTSTAALVLLFLSTLTALTTAKKDDPPLGCVQLENVAYRRFLIPANGTWPNFNRDRPVQYGATITGAKSWILDKVGKEFRFKTQWGLLDPAFLYVGEGSVSGGDRRSVFVSPLMRPDREVLWKLKKEKGGYYTVQNVNLKEYLFAGEPQYGGCNHLGCQQVSGFVFTQKAKSKNLGSEFLWIISTCF